jgi:hypothetical protein
VEGQKNRVRLGGSLFIQGGQGMIDQKGADKQLEQETRDNGDQKKKAETAQRRCSKWGRSGHYAGTCEEDRHLKYLVLSSSQFMWLCP